MLPLHRPWRYDAVGADAVRESVFLLSKIDERSGRRKFSQIILAWW